VDLGNLVIIFMLTIMVLGVLFMLTGGTSVVGEDVPHLVEVVGNIEQSIAIEATIAIMV
jgi:hypothetical protein